MMRNKTKPFVIYRWRSGNFVVVPKGLMGWLQFGVWLGLLGLLIFWYANHTRDFGLGLDSAGSVFLLIVGVLAWVIAVLWWMLSRAEVVDLFEVQRQRQLERRKRRRKD